MKYLKFKLMTLQILFLMFVFMLSFVVFAQEEKCEPRTMMKYRRSIRPVKKAIHDSSHSFKTFLDKLGDSDPSESLSVTDRDYVINELTDYFITLNDIEKDENLKPCIDLKRETFYLTKYRVVTFLVRALFEECKEKSIMQASDISEINNFLDELTQKIEDPNISLQLIANLLDSSDMYKIIHSLRQCGVDTDVFGEDEEVDEEGEGEEEEQLQRKPSSKKTTKKVVRKIDILNCL